MEDELLGEEASHDLDRLQVLIDLSGTGRSGYQAADWLRERCHTDIGLSDHRRILATLSFADSEASPTRLIKALTEFRATADRPARAGRQCRCRAAFAQVRVSNDTSSAQSRWPLR